MRDFPRLPRLLPRTSANPGAASADFRSWGLRAAALACVAAGTFLATMTAGAPQVLANEGGGGNSCPWANDATITIDGRTMLVPQAVFDPKTPQMNIDGYELVPALHQLTLRYFGPWGDVWESSLTRIEGGKRCIAFIIGQPTQTAEALPYAKRKAPPGGTAKGQAATAVVATPPAKH